MPPTLAVPRPRTLLLLGLALVSLFAVLHPSSPTHYSSLAAGASSFGAATRYSGYPPNLPGYREGGFNGSVADGGRFADRRHANATFVVLARNSDLWVRRPAPCASRLAADLLPACTSRRADPSSTRSLLCSPAGGESSLELS